MTRIGRTVKFGSTVNGTARAVNRNWPLYCREKHNLYWYHCEKTLDIGSTLKRSIGSAASEQELELHGCHRDQYLNSLTFP